MACGWLWDGAAPGDRRDARKAIRAHPARESRTRVAGSAPEKVRSAPVDTRSSSLFMVHAARVVNDVAGKESRPA